MDARELDIVVFGASGDTGIVGSCYLYFKGQKLGIKKWAPAARNLEKLQEVLLDRFKDIDAGPDGLLASEPIQADSGDYDSLLRMCARTKCVLACAGPFAQFGEGVVRACVEAKTHYVDITGEIPWVEKMMYKYGAEAEKNGISIVSCAGYDSVPPDLATFLAAKAIGATGDRIQRFEAFCGGWGGAAPTGTINTVLNGVDEGKRRALNTVTFGLLGRRGPPKKIDKGPASPVSNSKYVPKDEKPNCSKNLFWSMVPGYSAMAGQFCIPHFMAPINVNVVHHTAAVAGYAGLEYRERMAGLPSGPFSLYGLIPTMMSMGLVSFLGCFAPLPYFSVGVKKLRDIFNTPLQQHVRNLAFNGFQATGQTLLRGYGVSGNMKTRVKVDIECDYDCGLGFTMLSACTVAAELVKRSGTSVTPKAGSCSAVEALGGESLASALRSQGVKIEVTVQPSSRL